MTAPDKIYAWPSSTKPQGVSLAGGKVDDQVEYTRSDLIAARAVAWPDVVARGVVRDTTDPTGRTMYVLFDRAMSDDEMRDWHDQINALHPASPLGAVMDVPEVRALVEALTPFDAVSIEMFSRNYNASDIVLTVGPVSGTCLTFRDFLNVRAALAPFARKGE